MYPIEKEKEKERETMEQRLAKIQSIGECVGCDDLEMLIRTGRPLRCYNGFEPSGRLTFAQCMTSVINVNKLTSSGCHFTFWVADVFAKLNGKLGGDTKKIRKAGELMIKTWEASGMDTTRVEFIWASEVIKRDPERYWNLVIDISTKFTLSRMRRCTPALGREDTDELPLSTMMYSAMQCADILYLDIDLCQMGMDQLKINMLAREYCEKINRKRKPIILSHKILGGLDGKDKMSKSNPNSAIFMDDPPSEVNRKIKGAFLEIGKAEGAIFDLLKHIIMELEPRVLEVKRSEDNGGDITFTSYDEIVTAYESGKLHPGDLKVAVGKRINNILEPIQQKLLETSGDLLKTVKGYKIIK